MTVLGASSAVPEAIASASAILPLFVEIDELQREASRAISAATGAEAGFVTASSSAAITLTIAATMTGSDLEKIGQLPDARGMLDGVVIQRGHLINYGAPIDQAIRLAGARVVVVGEAKHATADQLDAALDDTITAMLFVVSHHTEQTGQIPLAEVVAACSRRRVPLIVDAASEYDLRRFIAAGADIVIYSAHKFLGGLTAGIIAGRKDLIRAAYLQNLGIGRGMKVGKEGIAGAIAAVAAWRKRNHEAVRLAEEARVALWMERLAAGAGIRVVLSPDPTGNPITRVRVHVDPETANTTAWALADRLAEGERPVMVRDDEIAGGYFELDPCNLSDGEAKDVAERILAELSRCSTEPPRLESFADWSARREAALLAWPDRIIE